MEISPPPTRFVFRLAIFHNLGKILNYTARHMHRYECVYIIVHCYRFLSHANMHHLFKIEQMATPCPDESFTTVCLILYSLLKLREPKWKKLLSIFCIVHTCIVVFCLKI